MRDFEEALGRELDRLEAPDGFAGRVMERVAGREHARRQKAHGRRLAIAASVLICLGLGGYNVEQRRQADDARAQFAAAMRVTGHSLARVNQGLARIDRNDHAEGEGSR